MTKIIAELGSVHDGSLGNALKLIEHCARAGVDACKLQDHRGEKVKGQPPWASDVAKLETREQYLRRTSFDRHAWQLIRATATACEVELIVSPFSTAAVGLLEEVPVDGFKIASGQVTNLRMVSAINYTGLPAYVSCGMTTHEETSKALQILRKAVLMQCTSEYPCRPEHVGLNIIREWKHHLAAGTIGFSDHTLGFAASLAAITLGATVIERHVTFHRGMHGTDARHSLTIDELARFVREVRDLDVMLANPVDKDKLAGELGEMRKAFLE